MYCERLIYKSQIQLLDKERILEAATFDRTKIRYVFFFSFYSVTHTRYPSILFVLKRKITLICTPNNFS